MSSTLRESARAKDKSDYDDILDDLKTLTDVIDETVVWLDDQDASEGETTINTRRWTRFRDRSSGICTTPALPAAEALSKMRQYWHPNLQRTVTSDNADRNQMESYSRMQEGALGVKTRLVILLGFGRDEVGAGLACTKDFDNGRVQHLAEFGLNLKGNSSTNCLR